MCIKTRKLLEKEIFYSCSVFFCPPFRSWIFFCPPFMPRAKLNCKQFLGVPKIGSKPLNNDFPPPPLASLAQGFQSLARQAWIAYFIVGGGDRNDLVRSTILKTSSDFELGMPGAGKMHLAWSRNWNVKGKDLKLFHLRFHCAVLTWWCGILCLTRVSGKTNSRSLSKQETLTGKPTTKGLFVLSESIIFSIWTSIYILRCPSMSFLLNTSLFQKQLPTPQPTKKQTYAGKRLLHLPRLCNDLWHMHNLLLLHRHRDLGNLLLRSRLTGKPTFSTDAKPTWRFSTPEI